MSMTFPHLHSFALQNCRGVTRDSLLVILHRTPYGAAQAGIHKKYENFEIYNLYLVAHKCLYIGYGVLRAGFT